MEENGVDHSGILTQEDSCTGQAYILSLTETADNSIVIVGGSNQNYVNKTVICDKWKEAIRTAEILMLQREIPEEINILAAEFAQECGVKVILDMGG